MKGPHDLPHDEQQLLQHYRSHSDAEPSAELDARILAAATQAARRVEPTPGPLARVHAWLFGGAGRTRWSVAFGSLALLGLGLGLSLKTLEQVPPVYDSPAPAAPAMQRYAAPAASMERKVLREEAEKTTEGSSMADLMLAEEPPAPLASAAPLARSSSEIEPWVPALQEVLALRKRGEEGRASALLEDLQRRYPQQDMDEQLRRLETQDQ